MNHRLTILGSGSSGGVPRLGNDWGACDPENRKNRRLRCAALVERWHKPGHGDGKTTVLIDSGPDVREQLLAMRIAALDGVVYTHDHADHTHASMTYGLFAIACGGASMPGSMRPPRPV